MKRGKYHAFLFGFIIAGLVPAAHADTLAGRASVIDGDTLEIHGERVRLWGVDAPESRQTCGDPVWRCGQRAANELALWIGQRTVTCEPQGKSYNRIVAVCSVGGTDIAAWLVTQGWALDDARYSGGAYADEQATARAAGRGVWAGEFEMPWDFRRKR